MKTTAANAIRAAFEKYGFKLTGTGENKLGPSPDRATIRSRTYAGIAAAMANQWGRA